ncbi:LysR substrate-binding domain-containing protein [Dactylosporangium sp. AC04546]|uniref:LysR family transcriptional regulator n=1 Tax=Dactylosporangium sp. AC04546 TaxID=2862460 RepID=UPI001EE10E6C|nr:LysR substrate-binding domain-containing protein [Dactylosporangium sp. AC04546]WVK86621.1 LysR substrate-binding domain-containing protein [Dactylosporangium sp. AC04546]
MNLAQLRALVAVAETGSITGAGTALQVTQSAVSHALASLETELDARLVVRERSGCVLTELGYRLLGHARDAVRAVERLAEEAAAARDEHVGRLLIGAFPSAGQLLPPLVARLSRHHPGVSVTLLEGSDDEVTEWLRAGIVDLATVTSALPGLAITPLADDEMLAVVPAGHPLAHEPHVDVEELDGDPFLLSDGGCEPIIQAMYAQAGLRLRPTHRVRDMRTLLAMVSENLGVTIAPSLAISGPSRNQLIHQGVVGLSLRPRATRTLYLANRAEVSLSPAARTLLDAARIEELRPTG